MSTTRDVDWCPSCGTDHNVDWCPSCGTDHNPWMSCQTARRLRQQANPLHCDHCGHMHTDHRLAGICVGCACTWRPAGTDPVPAEPVRSLGECRTLPMFSDLDAE